MRAGLNAGIGSRKNLGGGGGAGIVSSITALGASYVVPITSPITANEPVGQSTNGGILRIVTSLSATTIADISKIQVRVTDNGFDTSGNATTVSRTLTVLGHYLKTYNNETVTMPGVAGQFDVVLSDWLYNQDSTNKTTIVGVDFTAGWCTGGLTETVSTVTRQDSLAYPTIIVRPHFLPYEVVTAAGGNTATEWYVFHRLARNAAPVPFFRCRALVNGTYGPWTSANSETRSALTPSSGRNPSGYAAPVYACAGDVTGLAHATNSQAGYWQYEAYPWIGPALISANLPTPTSIAAGGGTTAQADQLGYSSSGADYNPLQMSIGVPFVMDATTPCCTPAVAWVTYDGSGTATGATKVKNNDFTDPGTTAAENFATFATAAAGIKAYNAARGSGAHSDLVGGVIMLRSVAGSAEGAVAGGYSIGTAWSNQTTYACGIGRVEIRAVGSVPDPTIRIQGSTAAGGAISATNHDAAQRILFRGVTFDGIAGVAAGNGGAANCCVGAGATVGASTTRQAESTAASHMFLDCRSVESVGSANPMFRQCGYMYFIRHDHNDAASAQSIGQFTNQFAGLVAAIGCKFTNPTVSAQPQLMTASLFNTTAVAGIGVVSARGAYNQPRPNNIAYVNSRVNYTTNGSKGIVLDNGASIDGVSIRGVFLLRTTTTTSPDPIGWSIFGDNISYDATNVNLVGCGGDHEGSNVNANRINIGYNDAGWNPAKRDIIDSYNAFDCYAIKTTWFNNTTFSANNLGTVWAAGRIYLRGDIVNDGTNGFQALQDVANGVTLPGATDANWYVSGVAKATVFGPQPGRVGNEAHTWHIGKRGTVGVTNAAGETAPGFQSYFGKVWQPGGQLNTNYANWYTTRSSGTGVAGDYRPAAGTSPLLSRIPSGMAYGLFDMLGAAIPNDGTGPAGAYMPGSPVY